MAAEATLHRANDFPLGVATTVDTPGYVDHLTGRHRDAISRHRQSITMLRELGYQAEVVADVHDHLGRPHAALGEWDEARGVDGGQGAVSAAQPDRRRRTDARPAGRTPRMTSRA